MSEYNEEDLALLQSQLKPALVLDASGTVTIANEGTLRLIQFSPLAVPSSQTPDSLIGKHISDLGLVLHPGDMPPAWTWDDILNAAHPTSIFKTATENMAVLGRLSMYNMGPSLATTFGSKRPRDYL